MRGVLFLLLAGLLASGSASSAPSASSTPEPCVAAEDEACLLGDRFRVRPISSSDGEAHAARVLSVEGIGQDTARFSFAPSDQRDRLDLTVRLVDGRETNGYFWLLSEASGDGAEIEVTDRVSGRTRRFLGQDGARSHRDLEAFSGEAQTVAVTLDKSRAVTKAISADGGSLSAVDAQGTRFQLVFPALALNLTTNITLTPVQSIAGLPLSGGLRGAVRITPEGLIPARSARLTITPAPAVPVAQQLTFAFRGLAGEFFLTPPLAGSTPLVVPVHRLGGYGLGAGSAADLAAQLARLPSREEDRLNQALAGLLLPLRRAGTKPVPATVAQLLQQEYNARIKPRLVAVAKGGVAKLYPKLRNWSLAARDTGLVPKEADTVAVLEARVRAAVLEGVRRDFLLYVDVCIGLKDRKAMVKAFSAFAELGRESALKPGDAEKLKRCVRFELQWDTELFGQVAQGLVEDVATTRVQLTLSQGKIFGTKLVGQAPTFKAPPCTTSVLALTPVTLTVDRVDIPNLHFFDDGAELADLNPTIYYDLLPGSQITRWRLACPDAAPINTSTSWVFMYILTHFDELDANFLFRAPLPPRSGDASIVGYKRYQRTVSAIVEDTVLILRHDPE